jgi:hypothetical protein
MMFSIIYLDTLHLSSIDNNMHAAVLLDGIIHPIIPPSYYLKSAPPAPPSTRKPLGIPPHFVSILADFVSIPAFSEDAVPFSEGSHSFRLFCVEFCVGSGEKALKPCFVSNFASI